MAVNDGRNVESLIGFVELSLRRLQHPPAHGDDGSNHTRRRPPQSGAGGWEGKSRIADVTLPMYRRTRSPDSPSGRPGICQVGQPPNGRIGPLGRTGLISGAQLARDCSTAAHPQSPAAGQVRLPGSSSPYNLDNLSTKWTFCHHGSAKKSIIPALAPALQYP